jgi:GT2 family glycosyltransferase/glycosyltransferase involved in cell wall biosynthesis
MWRLRRRLNYRLQALEFLLRRKLPKPIFQLLKPIYRRLGRQSAPSRSVESSRRIGLPIAPPTSYTIICFPIITWEYRFQRPQQLLTRFAKAGHRVYYLRTDFRQDGMVVEPLSPNIFGLCLPGPANLDIYGAPLSDEQIQQWLTVFDNLRQSEGLNEVVCLVQLPFWGPLALAARQRWGWRVVYDCMDEHSGFPSTRPDMLAQETPLIHESDLVLVTAQALYEKCAPLARRCVLLPNAADFEHFQRPGGEDALPDLPSPIIGYYGAIANWFETELVRAAAEAHPEWQFVLIGSDPDTNVRDLERLPNVHLLGEQPYSVLPSYLHRFDVAIIPFKINKLTRATNPVKFYEYLSAGKPVVAVPLPELDPYRDLVYRASTPKEFIKQIERALAEDDPNRAAARIALAKKNIWADRAATLDERVCQLYGHVSLVIVSNNNLDYLRMCLESVWTKTTYPNYEVVVVDNGSSTDVVEYLKHSRVTHRRLKVIFNADNLGHARATNIGLAAMEKSEFVVLLNSDTVVTQGWASRLIQHLQHDPSIGMVGPITAWANDEARFTTGYHSVNDLDVFAERQAHAQANRLHAMPTLDMFCVAIRRAVIDQVGQLDESFGQRIFEDADYALRLRQTGYKLMRAEDVVIHHWQQVAGDPLTLRQADHVFESDRQRFEAKWGQSSLTAQLFDPAKISKRNEQPPRG